jgi:hypothetical protein
MLRRIFRLATWSAVGAVVGYQLAYKPWRARWEGTADESTRPLPGDELVAEPEFRQTMALTIEAPPSVIWPWLLQMGYGRAGWYSYDAIDMLGHSGREIRSELQDVHVGDVFPIGPGFGFRVEALRPDRALVLFGDSEVIEAQQRQTRDQAGGPTDETAGLKFVGALSNANMSAFQVSWAFVLEPLAGEKTRLLERFRTRTTPGPAAAIVAPVIDVGHFLMTRRHMLGVKERAEAGVRSSAGDSAAHPIATAA